MQHKSKTFEVKVQNHGAERKTIEIPKEFREYFSVGNTVVVTMRKLS